MSWSSRRHATFLSLAVAAALGAGCASKPAPAPAPAPQVQPLAEYMSEAAKARADHLTAKERDTYRTAAQLYPTAKEPWMHLAESYFETGDYGNAVLAAQEVLQRDPADAVAASVLAVSGLRVSTQALSTLRSQNNSLPSDSRTQAESLTRTLRELLGENVLVPQPVEPAPVVPAPKARARAVSAGAASPAKPASAASAAKPVAPASAPAPAGGSVKAAAAVTNAASSAAKAPATAAPAPAAAKPAQPKNPFDALK